MRLYIYIIGYHSIIDGRIIMAGGILFISTYSSTFRLYLHFFMTIYLFLWFRVISLLLVDCKKSFKSLSFTFYVYFLSFTLIVLEVKLTCLPSILRLFLLICFYLEGLICCFRVLESIGVDESIGVVDSIGLISLLL